MAKVEILFLKKNHIKQNKKLPPFRAWRCLFSGTVVVEAPSSIPALSKGDRQTDTPSNSLDFQRLPKTRAEELKRYMLRTEMTLKAHTGDTVNISTQA